MSPLIIAAGVAGVVYLLTRASNYQPGVSTPTAPDSPPMDDVGGATHDATPPPDSVVGTQRPWSEVDRAHEGKLVTMPYFPSTGDIKPAVLTAPPPRGQKPNFQKPTPRDHVTPPSKTPGRVACIRAPCPVVPTSGQPDPHAVGTYASGQFTKGPVVF